MRAPLAEAEGWLPDCVAAGFLKEDAIWKGEIWLAGDVFVPEGVTLSIVPGAVIRCASAPEFRLLSERPPQGRWGLAHSDALRNVFVRGKILAQGEPDKPIRFGADGPWAGIHLKGNGRGIFSHVVFSGSAGETITAWDCSHVEISDVICIGNWAGFGVYNDSRASLIHCEIRQNAGYGLLCGDGAFLEANHCQIVGGLGGLAANGGRIRLGDMIFARQEAFGISLTEGEVQVDGASFNGAGQGLQIVSGKLNARGLKLAGQRDMGVWVGSRARADLTDCVVRGAHSGVMVEGGALSLRGCLIENQAGYGLRVDSGRVEAQGLEFGGQGDAAVYVTGRSNVKLNKCSARSTSIGIAAASGKIYLENYRSSKCRFPLSIDSDAELSIHSRSEKGALTLRSLLLNFVLLTKPRPFWRRIYRIFYQGALLQTAAWARWDGQVIAAWLHRGCAGNDWEPGISDLDFVFSVRSLEGRQGVNWLKKFWRRYDRSRILFPFKGETLIAEPPEHERYFAQGGIRAVETPAQAVLLKGELPGGIPTGSSGSPYRALWEISHSYTQFMVWWIYRQDSPWEVRRRHLFKAVLDVLRYSVDCGSFPGRREFWENIEQTPFGDWRRRLAPLLAPGEAEKAYCDRVAAELCMAYLPILDDLARRALPARTLPGPVQPCHWVFAKPYQGDDAAVICGGRLKLLERSQRRLGGAVAGAVLNDIYSSYLVLEDGVLDQGLDAENLARWARQWRADPAARNVPLLMSRNIWRCWQRLGYQENPLRFLELGSPSSREQDLFCAGEFLPGLYSFRWKLKCDFPEGIDGLLTEQAMASLACLRLQWRLMGSNTCDVSTGYMLHYLYSRILGLRLLLKRGIPAPFFALDQVLAYYRDEFPQTYRQINRLAPGIAEKTKKAAFLEHYSFLDSQLRAIR